MAFLPPIAQISAADVCNWQVEREDKRRLIEKTSQEIEQLDRKLQAAGILFPELFTKQAALASGVDMGSDSVGSWPELILYALSRADKGMTQSQILKIGKQTPLADRVSNSPNGLYAAVRRMEARGEIIKRGDILYLPSQAEAIEASDSPAFRRALPPPKGLPAAIIDLLSDGKARQPKEIFETLARENPEVGEKVRRNPQYGYNTISRLVAREQIAKAGPKGYYTLPGMTEGSERRSSEPSLDLGPVGRGEGFPPTAPEGSTPSGSTPIRREDATGTRSLSLVHSSPRSG
jgi:hypothetical protein